MKPVLLGVLSCTVLLAPVSEALPGNLGSTLQQIASEYGGEWGLGVIDLSSGDTETYNATHQFSMEIPHIPLTAFAIILSNRGEIPLDELIARNEFFWERLHWAQQGGRGMCMAVIWSMGEGRINEWISSNGYTGTEINGVVQDYPLCPAYDPNLINVRDALDFLQIIYDNLDQESVRNIGENPPFSSHIEETLGFENSVYGWMDISSSTKHLYMIIESPSGSDLGIVIMAEGLGDVSDVDRGFRTLYESLTD
jgi:hypothetical protein